MKYRHRVLALLFLLSIITYIDRVCIAVAGPRMQAELGITPEQWGLVMGAFAIAYAAFEIPSGSMGDRIGPRKVLTRIVLWWSVFTSLTGLAWNYLVLLPVRFLFGAGEAGAYPNSSSSISRWFPTEERARAHGLVWMASRVGGALSPFLVLPIQMRYGWRASFFAFGFLGIIWAVIWYMWYRDDPKERIERSASQTWPASRVYLVSAISGALLGAFVGWLGALNDVPGALPAAIATRAAAGAAVGLLAGWLINQRIDARAELGETAHIEARVKHGLPWGIALRSPNLWAVMFMYFTYCYGSFFFLSWMPTYLARGRGFSERGLFVTALPFVLGALANLLGGVVSDKMVVKLGLKWGRRSVAMMGLASAALFTVATVATADQTVALVFLALSYAGSDFMLPTAWAVCLDIGKKYAGAVTGAMNTAGQIGSFITASLFGYFVVWAPGILTRFGLPNGEGLRDYRYDVPLIPMTVMLTLSALLWLKIDPTHQLVPEEFEKRQRLAA